MSAASILAPAAELFARAGSPPQEGCSDVATWCVVCASQASRTALYKLWQGATFTDQNKLRGHGLSDRVCEACVWAHAWNPPPGVSNPPGKKGVNLRLFSHLYDARGYVFANKGNKPAIREWLCGPKVGAWWAAIADSGQKHVVPWARVNASSSGRFVRFEDRDVAMGDPALVDVMIAALTAGVTKDEIERGIYSTRACTIAAEHVRRLVELGRKEHGSGWWALAVWLAQRDEDGVAARLDAAKAEKEAKRARRAATKAVAKTPKAPKAPKGKTGGRRPESGRSERCGGGADQAAAPGVPAERRGFADALGPTPDATDRGVPDERDGRATREHVAPQAPTRGAQLGLFGGGGAAGDDDGR